MLAIGAVDSAAPPVGGGDSFPLGIIRNLSPLRGRRWIEQIETGDARDRRFAQLAFLRDQLPESFRTKHCLSRVQYGRADVALLYGEDHHSHFHGAAVCGSVWTCPVCAERITAVRRAELKRLLVQTKYRVIMATFTLSHHQGDALAALVDDLNGAIRSMEGSRAWRHFAEKWGIIGQVSALEVTYGRENAWHPHKHYMFLLDPAVIGKGPEVKERLETEMQLELFSMFRAKLNKVGQDCDQEHGVNIRANRNDFGDYIAKWGVSEELTRPTTKQASAGGKSVWDLLTDSVYGDEAAWVLFLEYAEAFKGKRQLHWSKGLRELLGLEKELSDEEAAESQPTPNDRVVLLVDRQAWSFLIEKDLLGLALKFSDLCGGDAQQVRDFLARTGLRRGVVIPEPILDPWEVSDG